ncbi:SLAIN motif-containing protein 1a isoform X1 [Larimichthys crocea]|uniref:SLAIN motif-containing protein 1a isoform X1 n=1 Tax=Larimichthys crocea TaxID=215358 RepID=UPI0009011AF7|nr:SLAIN motif-containing protein 1 isoform X1 [Larimichthys crocea]
MEAEVLNPQMMADVNGNNKISNAELEVLKLQELVRKLEKQNEQLRSRANAVNNCSIGPHLSQTSLLPCLHGGATTPCPSDNFSAKYGISSPAQTHPCAPGLGGPAEEEEEDSFAYFQPSSVSPDAAVGDSSTAGASGTVLDEVDILDLNMVLPVGEPDSWLYVSPKAKLHGESILSPLQWCRQVLDHPGPEVELAKMTLCHRLDQAKRRRGVSSVRPYSCIEGLSTLSCPVLPYTKTAALTESPAPLPSSGQSFVQPTLPLRPSCSFSDRAPTFLSNSTLHNVGRRHAAISPQSSLDSEVGVSELEDDTISVMSYKLQDMTDVEVMARLQEESLRQDYASTSATASRRSSSFSLHSLRRSEMDLEEEDEEDEGYDQLPPPQPRLFRTGSMQRGGLPHSHTFSSIRDCRRTSATPQFSLSGLSQYSGPSSLTTETHTAYRNSTDKLRRSMPNLIRAPSMPSVPSIPCLASPVNPPSHGPSSLPMISSLRSSQSFDSSNGLARLQSSIPSPGQLSQRVQSVGNFPTTTRHPLKATAYVSPTVQQGPNSTSLSSSISLHSIPSSTALSQPLKPSISLVPQPLKTGANQLAIPRSSLPRPASFVGTSGLPRASKITQPTRSLLTPPKSLAALSTLRDGSWKDGCY